MAKGMLATLSSAISRKGSTTRWNHCMAYTGQKPGRGLGRQASPQVWRDRTLL
jgi:hypothetical protein